jgi:hypothetical protein
MKSALISLSVSATLGQTIRFRAADTGVANTAISFSGTTAGRDITVGDANTCTKIDGQAECISTTIGNMQTAISTTIGTQVTKIADFLQAEYCPSKMLPNMNADRLGPRELHNFCKYLLQVLVHFRPL